MKWKNRYRVNMDITSWFLVSILDLGGDKVDMLMMLMKVFKKDFLGDDITRYALAPSPWAPSSFFFLCPWKLTGVVAHSFWLLSLWGTQVLDVKIVNFQRININDNFSNSSLFQFASYSLMDIKMLSIILFHF